MDRINPSASGKVGHQILDEWPVHSEIEDNERVQPRLINSNAESTTAGSDQWSLQWNDQWRIHTENCDYARRHRPQLREFSCNPGKKNISSSPSASHHACHSLSDSDKIKMPSPQGPPVTYRFIELPPLADEDPMYDVPRSYSQRIEAVSPTFSISADKISSVAAFGSGSEIIDLTSPMSDSFEIEHFQEEEAWDATSNPKSEIPLIYEYLDEDGRPLSPVNFA